jgi:multiple sugar transport system substrate-binding protein
VVRRDDFFPGALEPNEIDGRLVALPWYVDTRILFYRRDLLADAGVTDAPRSWDEWRTAMRRVREHGGGERFGIFLPIEEWQTPVVLALGARASLLADDDGRGNFRSEEVRRAFGFYVGLFADGLAPTGSDAQLANLYREFAEGYFAFFVTGPWNLGELSRRLPAELDAAWTTAPMPSPTAGEPGVSVAGGASLAVSSGSPRKDAAWKVVEYLMQPRVQDALRKKSGDLPSRRSAWDLTATVRDVRADAFRTQLDHLRATPRVPEWERIAARISLHLARVVRGETTLDDALAALDRDVDAILAKRRALAAEAAARRGSEGASARDVVGGTT